MCIDFNLILNYVPDKRSLRGPVRRKVPDATSGDHFRREIGQTKRRQNESAQDWERQQVPRVPSHQGKWSMDWE